MGWVPHGKPNILNFWALFIRMSTRKLYVFSTYNRARSAGLFVPQKKSNLILLGKKNNISTLNA